MKGEYIEGNKTAQILFWVLVFIALSLFVSSIYLADLFSEKSESFSIDQLKQIYLLVIIISGIISWLAASFFLWLGAKVKKTKQWPPQGIKIPFKTRIRREKSYVTFAWLTLYLGFLVFFIKPIAYVYMWFLIFKHTL